MEEEQFPYDEQDYIDPDDIEAEVDPGILSSPEVLPADYLDDAEEMEEGEEFKEEV